MRFLLTLLLLFFIAGCSSEKEAIKLGEVLFNKKHLGKNKVIGCVVCHSIKPDQVIVGPSLAGLSVRAPHLVAGESAEQYIKNSIVNPDAFIVGGYLPAIMFPHYAKELSPEEIEALVSYLSKI